MRQIFIFFSLKILRETEKLMSSKKKKKPTQNITGNKLLKDTEEQFQNSTLGISSTF